MATGSAEEHSRSPAVGLPDDLSAVASVQEQARRRDPAFREKVLPASYQMVFSQHLNGSDESAGKILAYHGASLILPQSQEYLPQPEFLEWHGKQVFNSPQRPVSRSEV